MDVDAKRLELIETILHLPDQQVVAAAELMRQINEKTSVGKPASTPISKAWPHAPRHSFAESGTYMVTTGTFRKQHFFGRAELLDLLESSLLATARKYEWHLEAWAAFSNH